MARPVKAAFEFEGVVVTFDRLLPTKRTKESLKQSAKYQTIVASIREIGVIEPLIVHPQKGGQFLLLDGHARVEALKELGKTEALCLISTDDEGYTYNHQVNPVAPIQANRMILKAIDAGVPEDRIAKALNLSLATVRSSRGMLSNICPEAVDLLKDKPVVQQTLREFKKVKPIRQIEMAELMIGMATYSASYAKALVQKTPREYLAEPEKAKRGSPGLRPEDLARMELEVHALEKDFLLVEETYSQNVMHLMLARAYLKKLLDNARVVRYLAQKHADVLPQFQRIVEMEGLVEREAS